jgi:PAS domain S-box-containing protein
MKNSPHPPIEDTELVLEELFRNAPVGVVLTDMFGTVIDANAALCAMLGYSRTELIGRHFADFSHPDDIAEVLARMDDLSHGRTGNYAVVNRRYLRRTGEEIQARVSVSIVYSKTREAVCGIGIIENITERAAMEAALRQSEMRYRRVVEDQTELITRCLPDGTLTFVNSAYCRYNNASAGALLGTSVFACMAEPEQQLVRAKFAALSPSNAVITEQHWVLAPGGGKRWHEWSDRGFFDQDGKLIEIQSVGRDLTEQHEAQQRLVASEERYRRLFNTLPVAVWENDWSEVMAEIARRGLASPEKFASAVANDLSIHYDLGALVRVTAVNPAALAMAGVATIEEFAEWLAHAATLESAVRWGRDVTSLMFGDSAFIMGEYTLVRANGESIDVMVHIARSERWGEEWMTYPIAFDVTERKRIERQLLHKQELTERAEAAARLGSWEWGRTGNAFYGSDEFWRIVGGGAAVERKDQPAAESFAALHPDDLERVNAIWKALRAPSREARPFVVQHEYRFPRPDGSVSIAIGQIFPTYDDDGSMIRAFGILRDVTEAKRAEEEAARHREELLRADRMIALGILVSGIAHEINNPNHAIALNVPLVRDAWSDVAALLDEIAAARPDLRIGRLPWPEARAEVTAMLDDVENASARLRYIVGELRSFALDHDRGDRREAGVNDIVTASMHLLGKHIARATRHFEMTLGDDIPPISGNAQRLEQVVVNLVINACQALRDEEQAIHLTTGFDGQRVFIRVQDEGCGIAAEHLPKVRTPFFTTKRGEGGTGLGIAVSDRIAAEHGGELTFESEVGRGTTATLWLPPARR